MPLDDSSVGRPLRTAPVDPRFLASLGSLAFIALLLSVSDGGILSIVLVVIGFIVCVISPIASVVAIVLALPLVYRPVTVGDMNWSLAELAIGFAAVSVWLRVFIGAIRQRSLQSMLILAKPWPTTIVAVAILVIGTGSLLMVADPRYRPDSLREFRWVVVEPIIAVFLFRWAIWRQARVYLVVAFIAIGAAVALSGLFQLLTGTGVVVVDGFQRATGPYRHPNNLALFLERSAIVTLALAIFLPRNRRLLVPLAVVILAGIVATLSRGAAMAYVAGAAWVAGTANVRHGWRWVGAGAVGAVALIGIVGADRLTDSGSAGATSTRELIWRSSFEMIQDHPVTGVGLDQFLNQYGRRYIDPAGWPERYTSHPHNVVLDFWLRLGLAGLAWLVAFAGLIAWLFRRVGGRGLDRAIGIAACGALIAGLVHGLVDQAYFQPDLAVATWFLVVLLESSSNPVREGLPV